ncbi:Predicted arabinose efflux permease, MFS family [Saccharopolyspora antimicrobica]|uniref:MFS family arabinose efflux permease n=1 Tax=Saccharopolyspora antimicrobica TaxID=455193 RepID=A0A1I5GSP2_9PSEU|nr:MFS transporter [Saccharopolyspora antimicrobica]RKT87373.1 putative MFS family arabinose efflux permease [Saccharopolyspora antimicrobica]SFO39022.1 Predicted arabinose efflux permease, MFS family [Saccharopolyspora antimicrobica]
MLGVLRHPTYRRLFTAQVIALLGTGLATVALALLAYRITGPQAGLVLGTALAIKMTANVLVAPVATALLGHLPRRVILVSLDVIRALAALLLPWVDQIWQIYLLVFVLQAASAAFTPLFQATIPDLLDDEDDYTNALSLSRLAYDMERLVSPALAAAALALVSVNELFLGTAIGFTASALMILAAVLPQPVPARKTGGVFSRTTLGVRSYVAVPRLRGLLALHLSVAAAGAMVLVNTVTVVRDDLAGSDADVTAALAVYGIGSLLVALSLPRALRRWPERPLMLTGSVLGAGTLAAVAVALHAEGPWRWSGLLAAWALLGAAGSLVLTPAGRLLRRSVDSSRRPALFAADYALSHGCWLITYPLAGWLATTWGNAWTPAALAMLAAAATFAVSHFWPADHLDEQEHDHHDLAPGHSHLQDAQPVAATGAWRHTHPYRLDDNHHTWPR